VKWITLAKIIIEFDLFWRW